MFIGQYNSTVQPHRLDNIFSVPTLNDHTAQPAFLNSVCQQHPHLNHVKFPHLSSYTGSLLIGVDPYDVICSCGVIHRPPKTPKALHTLLGWTIVGHSSHQLPTTAQVLLVRTPTMDDERFQQIHSWMRQDFDGVSSTKKVFQPAIAAPRSFSIQQQQKSKVATKSDFCRKKPSTYQIICGLPNVNNVWKEISQKTIDDHLARQYIVQVQPNDTTVEKGCLPHHPVTNNHKPGKVRRVTTASCVFKRKSLNSSLLTGPDFLCKNVALPTTQSRDLCGYRGYVHANSRGSHKPTISTLLVEEQLNNDRLRIHQTLFWRNRLIMCRLLGRATWCHRQCRRSSRHTSNRSDEPLYGRSLSVSISR